MGERCGRGGRGHGRWGRGCGRGGRGRGRWEERGVVGEIGGVAGGRGGEKKQFN